MPEAKVQFPKKIRHSPVLEFSGRLSAPQGKMIGITFEVDQKSFLEYQRLKSEGKVHWLGNPFYVSLPDEKGFPRVGRLEALGDQFNAQTGTLEAKGIMPNPDGLLLPGMSVRVSLPSGPPQKDLSVPAEAVLTDQSHHYVLVVNDKDIVERRDVTRGETNDKISVIEKGLSATDRVVVSGLNKLMPGTRVKPRMVGD